MSLLVQRLPITDALLIMLAFGTGKQVALGEAPAVPEADEPYAIVYPLPFPGLSGSLGNPEEQATFVYQVTSVGDDARQAQWMADAVRNTLLQRGSDGRFSSPIIADDLVVIDRRLSSGGGPEPGGGGLWQAVETYDLEVSA